MTRHLLIAAVLALAACATPAERCISRASAGLGDIDDQIAEAEANIARGYRLEDRAISTVGVDICSASSNVSICLGSTSDIPPRAVPIDVAAERARLASLKNQRAARIARMEREIEACKALN